MPANNFDLQQYLSEKKQLIDDALDSYLNAPASTPDVLINAMRYSALAPGKRLRPILVIAAAEAVGGTFEMVKPTAVAIELIHAFSLVHDDLPALDNDDLRRGLPTSHKKFGEANAILAGDALFSKAFELIALNAEFVPADRVCRALTVIAKACGEDGMVAGQVADIESEGKDVTIQQVDYIHSRKTAALLSASVSSGAILAGADDAAVSALWQFGENIGLAFQILDDVLNITSTPEQLGKAVGSDEERGKATYPGLIGLEQSKQKADELIQSANSRIEVLGGNGMILKEIADYVVKRRS